MPRVVTQKPVFLGRPIIESTNLLLIYYPLLPPENHRRIAEDLIRVQRHEGKQSFRLIYGVRQEKDIINSATDYEIHTEAARCFETTSIGTQNYVRHAGFTADAENVYLLPLDAMHRAKPVAHAMGAAVQHQIPVFDLLEQEDVADELVVDDPSDCILSSSSLDRTRLTLNKPNIPIPPHTVSPWRIAAMRLARLWKPIQAVHFAKSPQTHEILNSLITPPLSATKQGFAQLIFSHNTEAYRTASARHLVVSSLADLIARTCNPETNVPAVITALAQGPLTYRALTTLTTKNQIRRILRLAGIATLETLRRIVSPTLSEEVLLREALEVATTAQGLLTLKSGESASSTFSGLCRDLVLALMGQGRSDREVEVAQFQSATLLPRQKAEEMLAEIGRLRTISYCLRFPPDTRVTSQYAALLQHHEQERTAGIRSLVARIAQLRESVARNEEAVILRQAQGKTSAFLVDSLRTERIVNYLLRSSVGGIVFDDAWNLMANEETIKAAETITETDSDLPKAVESVRSRIMESLSDSAVKIGDRYYPKFTGHKLLDKFRTATMKMLEHGQITSPNDVIKFVEETLKEPLPLEILERLLWEFRWQRVPCRVIRAD